MSRLTSSPPGQSRAPGIFRAEGTAPKPEILIAVSVLLWIVLWSLSGLRYNYEISPFAWASLAIAILGMLVASRAGYLLVRRHATLAEKRDRASLTSTARSFRRAVMIASTFSIIGFGVRVATGNAVLPTSSSLDLANSRLETMADTTVRLSEIGTPLSTFGLVAGVALAAAPAGSLSRKHHLVGWFAVAQYVLMGVALGSRTQTAFVATAIAIGYLCRRGRPHLRLRTVLAACAVIAAIALLSYWILAGRLVAQGFSPATALAYLSSAHSVLLPEWATADGGQATVADYTIVSLAHYFVHGVYEYGYLYTWREGSVETLGWGMRTFSPVSGIAMSAMGISVPAFSDLSPRFGVYQGLFGSFLVDFGPIGMVLCGVVLGVASGAAYAYVSGSASAAPVLIYSPLGVILVASPYFDAVGGAFGVYTMIASSMVAFMVKTRSPRG